MFGRKAHVMRTLKDSTDPAAIRAALLECRDEGWLTDGSLHKIELEGADLQGFDLSRADFTDANLAGAILRKAALRRAILYRADLSGCDLSRADLSRADLRSAALEGANLRDAQVSVYQLCQAESLTNATMPDGSHYDGRFNLLGDLLYARQKGAYPDKPARMAEWYGISETEYQSGQDWANQSLKEIISLAEVMRGEDHVWIEEIREAGRLADGSLRGEDFSGMTLAGVELRGALLRDCVLDECDLVRAVLTEADLRGASLVDALLHRADLSGANLEGASLDGAYLTQADLTGAVVTDGQLARVSALLGATMPDGTRYDGRYNLEVDIEGAANINVDIEDADQMAEWYDVPQAAYNTGQRWAEKNLARLRPDEEYGE